MPTPNEIALISAIIGIGMFLACGALAWAAVHFARSPKRVRNQARTPHV